MMRGRPRAYLIFKKWGNRTRLDTPPGTHASQAENAMFLFHNDWDYKQSERQNQGLCKVGGDK